MTNIKYLIKKSQQIRSDILEMCIKAKTGHLTSSLSCVDILVALYYNIMQHYPSNPKSDERDRFILSKGQASPALYTILGDLNYFDKQELDKFAQKDGIFGVHLQKSVPGVEITTGSLGHGLNVGAGIALALKKDRKLNLVFVLLGDGECHEGSVWESALFASSQCLNNLIVIIDRNFLCATDFTENCVALEDLSEKWKSFGWSVERIDGHDMKQLVKVLTIARSRNTNKPKIIIADTIKGCGIQYICDKPLWHSRAPTGDDIVKCRIELFENGKDNI